MKRNQGEQTQREASKEDREAQMGKEPGDFIYIEESSCPSHMELDP